MCASCSRLQPRSLNEVDIGGRLGRQKHIIKQCRYCKENISYQIVQLADIPEALRNLSANALWALRPMEIWQGFACRAEHGYRVHTDMTRFHWRPQNVEAQIAQLEADDKEKAKHSHTLLMSSAASSYRRFIDYHEKILAKEGNKLTGDIENDC